MTFRNTYEDAQRAEAYARLEFANTYYLAYRDLPRILQEHVRGSNALDFGCGTGRSTRFLRKLGFSVIGIDIAPEMIAKAHELDPEGDYCLTPVDNFTAPGNVQFELVLSMFTFDNIPGTTNKIRLFHNLRQLLTPTGRLISVVSTPQIYVNEWASFSTKDFPENSQARSGDIVKIVTTEIPDRRPTEDILFTDEAYRDVYRRSGLQVLDMNKPLAHGDEPYHWVNETSIAPWAVYVLAPNVRKSRSTRARN
jgi:SAM-dependent methyltransferase